MFENEKAGETSVEAAAKESTAAEQVGIPETDKPDTEPEAERETNDAEFADGAADEDERRAQATEAKAEESKQKPVQSRERNAEEARKRREAEKAEAVSKARIEAIIEATDGVNPYTGKEIKDADDVEEYLNMRQIKKNGGDPVDDYSDYLKQKKREERQAAEAKAKMSAKIKSDLAEFHEKFPDVNVQDVLADQGFSKFADGKYGRFTLASIYSDYRELVGSTRTAEQKKAAQVLANSRATPGAVATAQVPEDSFFTREAVAAMSQKQVHDNWDKIQKSMEKWKK